MGVFLNISFSIIFNSNILSNTWCAHPISTFLMAPKLAKIKSDSKGKGKASYSSIAIETPFSLVSQKCIEEFKKSTRVC